MVDKLGVMSQLGVKAQPEKAVSTTAPKSRTTNELRAKQNTRATNNDHREFSKELNQVSSRGTETVEAREAAPAAASYAKNEIENEIQPNANTKNTQPKLSGTQKAMAQFLVQMENEFGVDPEELLQAFSDMSATDLTVSPEKSAESLISSLGLNESDSNKALSMYYQMLIATMGAATTGAQQTQQGKDVNLRVLDPKEAQIKQLRTSIDTLNHKFFDTGAQLQQRAMQNINGQINTAQVNSQNKTDGQPATAAEVSVVTSINPADQQLLQQTVTDTAPTSRTAVDPSKLGMSPASSSDALAVPKSSFLAKMQNAENTKAVSTGSSIGENSLDQKINSASAQAANANVIPNAQAMPMMNAPVMPKLAPATTEVSTADATTAAGVTGSAANAGDAAQSLGSSALKGIMSAAGGAKADSDQQDDSENLGELDTHATGDTASTLAKAQTKSSFVLTGPKPTALDMQANVKEIISQAQFLASKGGGEMKISLNPDGMGELKLKVKANDGQINVEMITSSSESKKLLEKGLSDLKDHLAAHKLNLESIRIESSKEISHQMNQNPQQQQGQLDHDNQRFFLNDFRNRNNDSRREMYEFGAPSRPSSQTRDPAANLVYGTSAKRRGGDSSTTRRLDLVA